METTTAILLWLLAILLVAVGIAGTVLPALPGPALVLAGLVLIAWIDDFARVGGVGIGILAALTVLSYAVDFAASAYGTRRLGAVVGEYTARRDLRQAGRAGAGAWLGILLGVAAKLALIAAMLGVFAADYAGWVDAG